MAQDIAEFQEAFPDSKEEGEEESDDGNEENKENPNPEARMLTEGSFTAIHDASHVADTLQILSDYLRSASLSVNLTKAQHIADKAILLFGSMAVSFFFFF